METSLEPFLDRALQLELLQRLRSAYPGGVAGDTLASHIPHHKLVPCAAYLMEHKLIDGDMAQYMDLSWNVAQLQITAAGLDFLAQDGGLTAILGVLTVRLDAETIRGLIQDKVESSPMPAAEKSALRSWLKTAGSEALKEATKRLVVAALDHAPDVLLQLQRLPG